MFIKNRSIKQKAFTLIEVITVSLIIGILIYAASASIPRISEDLNYKSNITKLEYMLKSTKLLAIRESKTIGIISNKSNNTFEIRNTNFSISSIPSTASSLIKVIKPDGQYKVSEDQSIIFDGRGIAVKKDGKPCFYNGIVYIQAEISSTGIFIKKGNGPCP